MEGPEEFAGVSVAVYRRQPRPALQRLLLLLLLSASALLAASPCAELSRVGQRKEFEECAAQGVYLGHGRDPNCVPPAGGRVLPSHCTEDQQPLLTIRDHA